MQIRRGLSRVEFELQALTPLDGRYAGRVAELGPYFSEQALIKYRVLVEVKAKGNLVLVKAGK